MKWIPISERLPAIGKLVYTKDDQGNTGVYTLFGHGWHSKISTDNNAIVEWLDEEEEQTVLSKRALFFRDLVYDYERYMEQGQTETALFMLDHLAFQIHTYVMEERTPKATVPPIPPAVSKAKSFETGGIVEAPKEHCAESEVSERVEVRPIVIDEVLTTKDESIFLNTKPRAVKAKVSRW